MMLEDSLLNLSVIAVHSEQYVQKRTELVSRNGYIRLVSGI